MQKATVADRNPAASTVGKSTVSTTPITASPTPRPLSATRGAAARAPRPGMPNAATWRSIGTHLMIPLFLAIGMAFAYLGAFHAPDPHNLPVAVVGSGPQTSVFAQTLNDKGDGKVSVRTVADAAQAKKLIIDQKIIAA
jgi:hypothetical protein